MAEAGEEHVHPLLAGLGRAVQLAVTRHVTRLGQIAYRGRIAIQQGAVTPDGLTECHGQPLCPVDRGFALEPATDAAMSVGADLQPVVPVRLFSGVDVKRGEGGDRLARRAIRLGVQARARYREHALIQRRLARDQQWLFCGVLAA